MKIHSVKPFGPSILKTKIPEDLVNKLNEYVDGISSDKKKINELDNGPNLAGDVTQELILESEFIKKIGWLDFLGNCVSLWIKTELKEEIKSFNVLSSWIVRQYKYEYNPIHWHGGHISGAGFLKVPNTLGNYNQSKKNSQNYSGGNLNFIHGSKMFLSESTISVKPEVGDFYFFPNYLMHTVYPFKDTSEERRSISFNALIDQDIYNVYGK